MIDQWVQILTIASFGLGFFLIWLGFNQIRRARQLPYFGLRRKQASSGWRVVSVGSLFLILTLILFGYGKRIAYFIVEPTPTSRPPDTPSATPSITPRPSQTLTPSASPTATITHTPSQTPTPKIPEPITVLFNETVTPDANAVFSRIEMSRRLDNRNRPINPAGEFENPIGTLYGAFSYDFMTDGARWTALWYRGDRVVCVESKPWDGGTGGYGYTECTPGSLWLPGEYEIQMFLGEQWRVSTRFSVLGNPNTPTPSPTPGS